MIGEETLKQKLLIIASAFDETFCAEHDLGCGISNDGLTDEMDLHVAPGEQQGQVSCVARYRPV